jgi:hypothetical protein
LSVTEFRAFSWISLNQLIIFKTNLILLGHWVKGELLLPC